MNYVTYYKDVDLKWLLKYTDGSESQLVRHPRSFSNALGTISGWLRPHEMAGGITVYMVNNGMRIVCRVDGITTAVINLTSEEA